MQTLDAQLKRLHDRIISAEKQFKRTPGSVRLLAVSKGQPAAAIEHLFKLGQRDLGESYLQEALPKIKSLANPSIRWHFIGHIQSNKTRDIAEHFDWVHSIDRYKIAQRLNDQRPASLTPLNVCLQIKPEADPAKSGASPEQAMALAEQVARLPRLKLRGLMCIPVAHTEIAEQRRIFARMRQLQTEINRQGYSLDTLSMGMSNDLEAAIAEGATLIRIGNALFGPRQPV